MRPCAIGSPPAAWTWTRNGVRNTAYHASLPRPWAALSTVWLLDLPRSSAWIQDNFLELTRQAAPLRLSEAWDLPRSPGPYPDRPAPTLLLAAPVQ